jgi:hypothetical protein
MSDVYSDRMDRTIAFSVLRTPKACRSDFQDPDPQLGAGLIGADLIEYVQEAVGTEVRVRGVPAQKGRGASGLGAALQVLTNVEAVAVALAFGAKITRSAYRALRRRLGYRPNVSLGAANYLAAADLIDRLDSDDFELLGSGDTDSSPMDSSFTGEDTFWVVFSSFPVLYIYIVAANGRVHYMGSHEILAATHSRLHGIPGSAGRHARPDVEDDEEDSYDDL